MTKGLANDSFSFAAAKLPSETSLHISSGTLEGIKYLALILMTLDHVNKFWFKEAYASIFLAGRLAMPLFAFSLAYNLARPGSLQKGVHVRTIKRLFLFGLVASPIYFLLANMYYGWPLNILFLLLAGCSIVYLIEKGGALNTCLALLIFIFGGALVEFWWFGLAFFLASWRYCKSPTTLTMVGMTVAAAGLYVVNRNMWALAAVPLIFLAPCIDLKIARYRHIFYAYYPVHLGLILAAVRIFNRA